MAQDYGIKISKSGFDVRTADLKDQILNSSANSLKIWLKGSTTINAATGSVVTVNVAHGLGYQPFFFAYFQLKRAGSRWFQFSTDTSRLPGNFSNGDAKADATNLKLSVFTDEANYTATVYYIIFIDKAYE